MTEPFSADPSARPDPHRRFFGRRKGPSISPRKQGLLDTHLPHLRVTPPGAGATLDPAALFPRRPKAVWLEIGFGKGEHLAWQAARHPDVGFIGCEPYLNGMAALLDRVVAEGLDMVRVYDDDARDVLEALPEASVGRVFLLQPDPWPKARHARRRFVNDAPLDAISRVLEPGGELRISTDDPTYKAWTAVRMAQRADFRWLVESPRDWHTPPDDWPVTRYAHKARCEGRTPAYFRYGRVATEKD